MGFKVGQLFIWPLAEDLFSVDAFSIVPLLTFPLSLHCVPHPPTTLSLFLCFYLLFSFLLAHLLSLEVAD